MDYIKPTPQNPVLGAAAEGLRSARSALDVVPLPKWLGGGLGQLVIGKAPEEVTEWSYGNSPVRINPNAGRTASFVPEIKQERKEGVMDTVLLPAAETAALANLGTRGLRTAYGAAERAVAQAPTETGRREFLRKAGTLTAGTAAAAATPDIVKGAAKLLDAPSLREAPAVAARVAARATPAEFYAAYRTARLGGEAAYERAARPFDKAIKEADDEFAAELSRRPNTSNEDYYAELDFGSPKAEDIRLKASKLGRDAQAKYEADALQKLRGDPRFAGFKTPDELEDLARADSMAGKNDLPTYWAEARKIGLLPDEEIESALKTGKSYTDPTTGNSAFLNKYGQMEWRSPEGHTARYQHWIPASVDGKAVWLDIPF